MRQEGGRRRPAVRSAPAQIVRGAVPAPPIWDGVMETWFPILDACLNIVQQLQVFPHRRSLNLVPAAELNGPIRKIMRLNVLTLKVHKIEIFFGFDFDICNISVLVMSKY